MQDCVKGTFNIKGTSMFMQNNATNGRLHAKTHILLKRRTAGDYS